VQVLWRYEACGGFVSSRIYDGARHHYLRVWGKLAINHRSSVAYQWNPTKLCEVRLRDDLAGLPVALGQQILVAGYKVFSELPQEDPHGVNNATCKEVLLAVSVRPWLPAVPNTDDLSLCRSPLQDSTQKLDVEALLDADLFAESLLPFIPFRKAKLALLLAVSACTHDRGSDDKESKGRIHLLTVGGFDRIREQFLLAAAALTSGSVARAAENQNLPTVASYDQATSRWKLNSGQLNLAHGGLFLLPSIASGLKKAEVAAFAEVMEKQHFGIV